MASHDRMHHELVLIDQCQIRQRQRKGAAHPSRRTTFRSGAVALRYQSCRATA